MLTQRRAFVETKLQYLEVSKVGVRGVVSVGDGGVSQQKNHSKEQIFIKVYVY